MTKIVNSDRFFRVYDNIPINTRKELIVIIDDKPMKYPPFAPLTSQHIH